MKILFPVNPIDTKEADGPFQEEYHCLKSMGVGCSLFDYDTLAFEEFRPKPALSDGDVVLYRGWMMSPDLYTSFARLVTKRGATMLTSPADYLASHHLPNWYDSCREYTAETCFLEESDQLEQEAAELGWPAFFVKDYVKSNYNERGSIAQSPAEVTEIIDLIREHRGEIEGGISLRRVEQYRPETESRYFVFKGTPWSADGSIPDIVKAIAGIHQAPFYSVDIIEREDGELRLVELGDGQVSDRKSWDADVFCKMLA